MVERESVKRLMQTACNGGECCCSDEAIDELTAALNGQANVDVLRRVLEFRETRFE